MIVHLSCVASDCSLLFLKKGDPPANLRDADGFCYRSIRNVLSENLLHFVGKDNAFLLNLQLFRQFSSSVCITLPNFHYLCSGIGEKSGFNDALAYYFALD